MKIVKTASPLILLLLGACLNLSAGEQTYTRLDSKAIEQKRLAILSSQANRELVNTKARSIEESSKPKNVIERSMILSANGYSTLVPKGAILHLPSKHSSKIVQEPEGNLIAFPEFLRKNIAWLTCREVSMKEAVGDQPLNEQTKEACLNAGRIVISTIQRSPVSTHISKF